MTLVKLYRRRFNIKLAFAADPESPPWLERCVRIRRKKSGNAGLAAMGSCYSVAYTWYAWMVGSQVTSAGLLRYRNEPVDGETTIEFQHLVDADEELLELGQGNQPVSLITEEERRHLQTGRYDEILVHSTRVSDEVDGHTRKIEQDLRLEEEAYYEARREAARAARQAQALEATRAAAATVAAAQATHAAMTQNADVFSSAPLPPADMSARSQVAPPPSDSSALRQEARLDAQSQLDEFSRTAAKQDPASTAESRVLSQPSTSAEPSSSATDQTTLVQRDTSQATSATPDEPAPALVCEPQSNTEDSDLASATQAVIEKPVIKAASLVSEPPPAALDSQPAGNAYSILDDDVDDFDSFLESVKAKNFGPAATAKGAEIARGTSPPPIENGFDDEDFTAFEESLK